MYTLFYRPGLAVLKSTPHEIEQIDIYDRMFNFEQEVGLDGKWKRAWSTKCSYVYICMQS